MGLHRIAAIEARARPAPAADRLVILIDVVAEEEIVHRRLGAGERPDRAEQRIAHRLRHFRIPRHHRPAGRGAEKGSGRDADLDRGEAPLIERDVGPDQAAEDIEHRGARHRGRGVEITLAILRPGAGEVDEQTAPGAVHIETHREQPPVIHLVAERPIAQPVDHPPHALLGMGHDVAHIGRDQWPAIFGDHRLERLAPPLIGGDLRLDVGDVEIGIARGVAGAGEEGAELRLAEAPLRDEEEVVDHHPLLFEALRTGRGRARGEAADIGVVAARGDEIADLLPPFVEDRRNHGDVGEVGAALIGIVERNHIARPQPAAAAGKHGAHALAHRAEMHRHMRSVGDEPSFGIEQGTGEVEPLLDVDAARGVLEHDPRLARHMHEEIAEEFEPHRIGADEFVRLPPYCSARDPPPQDEVIARAHLRLPAGLDHRGGVGLADQRRPLDAVGGGEMVTIIDRNLVPRPATEKPHPVDRRKRGLATGGKLRLGDRRARRDHFGRNHLDDQGALRRVEAETAAMRCGEGRKHCLERTEGHGERGIRPLVAEMERDLRGDPLRRSALGEESGAAFGGEFGGNRLEFGHQRGLEGAFDGTLAHHPLIGEPHAVGRQHAGEGVDEDALHAERIGDQAGMLSACAAEANQGEGARVEPLAHRDLLDRVRHVVDRDGDEPLGEFLGPLGDAGGLAHLLGEPREVGFHRLAIEQQVALRPEDRREMPGLDLAEQEIGIGDGERPAIAVAGGAR